MTTTTEIVTCRYCRKEFVSNVIDGSLQCTDGAGDPTCDDCYDDTTGYGRTQED